MRILVSNDDGVLAPGLAALASAVADLGDVFVVAPDSPQSAAGHGITLKEPLTVREVPLRGSDRLAALSVDGRPADCVRLAIRELIDPPPDIVLSGINAGANVGINIFYSGTVAAAAEAAMLQTPAVAFSADIGSGDVDFDRVARLCRWVLDGLLNQGLTAGQVINVNVPALRPGRPCGLRVAPQSTAGLVDIYHRQEKIKGRQTYQLGGDFRFAEQPSGSDAVLLAEGYITVTPLHVDMTNHSLLDMLATIRWGVLPD